MPRPSPEQIQKNLEALREWENEKLKTNGWFAHYVFDEEGRVNCHTHGLKESLNHPDLQIIFPLDRESGSIIHSNAVKIIKGGVSFTAGVRYNGIVTGREVTFAKAHEGEREILRMIIPGEDLVLEKGKMGEFDFQWEDTEE